MEKTSFFNRVYSILRLRCPNCGKGDVYKKDSLTFGLFPDMEPTCKVCGHHYDREPGYFLGAMYASYGLAVAEGLITFVLVYFFLPNLSTFFTALIPALVILALASRNYKLGRVIWMHLFPR